MKKLFIFIFVFVAVVLMAAIPIFINGYIFSDDSFADVMKTSIMLSTGMFASVFVGVILVFIIIAKLR